MSTPINPNAAALQTGAAVSQGVASSVYGPSSKRPINPYPGYLYYDTTLGGEVVWNPPAWEQVSKPVPVAARMVSGGTAAARPSNPPPYFIYFNVDTQQQEQYNGSAWVIIGPSAVQQANRVSDPSFSPAGGAFTGTQSVGIFCPTSGATIRYTTDGSTPTSAAGTVYSGPVTIAATTTLRAIAYKSGILDSGVVTASFTINSVGQVADPTYSPAPGTFGTAQTVTISSATSGATIRYTTDGSTPTSSSGTVYSGPVNVGASLTIKAIAYKAASTDSNVTSAAYLINPAPPSTRLAFTRISATATVTQPYPAFAGFFTTYPEDSSVVFVSVSDINRNPLPPGITVNVVQGSTNITVFSVTTDGGEASVTTTIPLATYGAGAYSMAVSTDNAIVALDMEISTVGAAIFYQCSCRAGMVGPILLPPNGASMTLTAAGIDTTTRVGTVQLVGGDNQTPLLPPIVSFNFGGDTTSNPKYDFSTGLPALTLFASVPSSYGVSARLEINPIL